jgi:hypothetical protein
MDLVESPFNGTFVPLKAFVLSALNIIMRVANHSETHVGRRAHVEKVPQGTFSIPRVQIRPGLMGNHEIT